MQQKSEVLGCAEQLSAFLLQMLTALSPRMLHHEERILGAVSPLYFRFRGLIQFHRSDYIANFRVLNVLRELTLN